jgi:hypothetical protein
LPRPGLMVEKNEKAGRPNMNAILMTIGVLVLGCASILVLITIGVLVLGCGSILVKLVYDGWTRSRPRIMGNTRPPAA